MQVLKPEIREDILAAARELFFDLGFQGATMRLVADRVGMSVGNLYKYFKNKEEMFESVVGAHAASFKAGLRAAIAHDKGSEFDPARVQEMVEGLARAIALDPKVFIILVKRCDGSPHAGFKDECVGLMTGHVETSSDNLNGDPLMTRIIISNLFSAFAEIAFSCRDENAVRDKLSTLFRYHMAGYRAVR